LFTSLVALGRGHRVAATRKVVPVSDQFPPSACPTPPPFSNDSAASTPGVVLAAQSIEGLHDDPAERDRLLNSASTLIAHRLADPDPIVTGAGTIRRPERSHQLDTTGATGMGSLRLQDTYRIDPNDLRSLPRHRLDRHRRKSRQSGNDARGRAPLAGSPRRDPGRHAPMGSRNNRLNQAAFSLGTLVTGGDLDEPVVESALLAVALDAGLPEAEARASLASGLRAGARSPRRRTQ
jgi:hypothetical protein